MILPASREACRHNQNAQQLSKSHRNLRFSFQLNHRIPVRCTKSDTTGTDPLVREHQCRPLASSVDGSRFLAATLTNQDPGPATLVVNFDQKLQ
jgi:hypothetical protein